MNKKTQKQSKKHSNLNFIKIGTILLVSSPLLYIILPAFPFFFQIFCGQNAIGNGCGYAGLGVVAYALYVALVPFVIGLILLVIGLITRKK